jgi:hypothetical protein
MFKKHMGVEKGNNLINYGLQGCRAAFIIIVTDIIIVFKNILAEKNLFLNLFKGALPLLHDR